MCGKRVVKFIQNKTFPLVDENLEWKLVRMERDMKSCFSFQFHFKEIALICWDIKFYS